YGGGLFTYKFGGKLTSITNENGLLDDTISQLVFDKEGDLWLAGNLGVFQIEKSQLEEYLAGKINRLKVSKLGVKEGLPIRETTGGFMPSSFLNDEGVLFIPTMQGLAEIHTNRMKVNRSLPNVVIEEIEIDGEIHSIYDLPKITYKDQRFVFKFATLSFQNPANVQFQYMLEGFDKSWQVGDGVLEVVYTSLSPGDYTLRIKAANNDGFWNEEGASFTFNIEPPFWETIWFYSLLVILFFSSVYGFTQYRMRLLQKREKNLTKLVGEQTAIIRKEKELLAKTNGDLEKSKKLIEKSKSKIEEQSFLLKKNDQVKSMFFANISQELRTPLTLIKGILEQNLKAQKSSNKAGKNFGQDLAKMASYANRLQSQVNYLLELSKVETGDVSLVKKVYDLNFQVSLLGDLFQTLSSENEVDFSFELAANPILIQADPGKIEKVILSLFIKFLHYTDKTGWIQMSTSTEKKEGNDWAQFTMESSKTGISEEEKFLLFNRFNYQTKTPGISIHSGFALVKEWVNLHGGELVLDSVEANNLKIQILLPQLVLEAEDSKEHINVKASREIIDIAVNPKDIPDNSQALFDEHKKTVLLIEDSLPVRIYTRELLKKDYNILEAGDAVKGMEIIFNKDPKIDLVISDLMMPKMDGYELCRKLRKHPDTSTIPFILLTAKAGEDSYLDGIKSGIDAFITKPFNENVLKETVKRLVENRDRLLRQFMDKESLNLLVAANDEKDTLLNKVDKLITENMEDAELSVETLALWLHMSPRQLQRNLKEATGLTPIKYLRKRRLEAARHLIEQDYGTISEVAYAVGFNTLSLFSSYFKKEFGKLPSDWHKTNNS
ncbi:MAG: helix-turn-helix domain-containing protein, partial [Balneolaceae bacterium]